MGLRLAGVFLRRNAFRGAAGLLLVACAALLVWYEWRRAQRRPLEVEKLRADRAVQDELQRAHEGELDADINAAKQEALAAHAKLESFDRELAGVRQAREELRARVGQLLDRAALEARATSLGV